MKALELNNLLGKKEVNMRKLRKKLENVKACTDTSAVSLYYLATMLISIMIS